MNCELIAIGTELLLGAITDTNSAYIARALRDAGVDLWWMSVVGDNEARIAETVGRALQRSDIVITTGGLGPTVDDPTRAAIARACQRPLEYREELWEQIANRFQRFGRKPSENNKRQAYVPAGARALENPVGTAPCFIVETERSVLIALPGVPREMEHMLTHAVLPYLRQRFNLTGVITAKVLRTVGIGESLVDEKVGDLELLSNPTVGLAAHAGQTDIRITAKAASAAEAEALIAPIEAQIRQRLGHFIYGEGQQTVEAAVCALLRNRGDTLAVADPDGKLSERLARTPEASDVLRGGNSFEAAATPDAVALHAAQARDSLAATWGLAMKVDLRPEAGQIYLALRGPNVSEARTLGFASAPSLAADWAATAAFNLLRLALLGRLAG